MASASLFFRIIGTLGTMVLVVGALFVGRLAYGPISLDPFIPWIRTLATMGGHHFTLSNLRLSWKSLSHAPQISAFGVAINNQSVSATVPRMLISLDPGAILHGRISLGTLFLFSPRVRIERDGPSSSRLRVPDVVGSLVHKKGGNDSGWPGLVFSLKTVSVVDASVTFIDHDRVWRATNANVDLWARGNETGGSATLTVKTPHTGSDDDSSVPTHINASWQSRPHNPALRIQIKTDHLRPASLALLHDRLALLSDFDMIVSGDASVEMTGASNKRSTTLTAGGSVHFATSPSQRDNFSLTAILAPNLRSGSARLALGEATVETNGEQGPNATGGVTAEITTKVENLSLDALKRYWPPAIAPNPREWIARNIETGRVSEGAWRFVLQGDSPTTLALSDLEGWSKFKGATVHYMAAMPPATGVGAIARYSPSQARLEVERGQVGRLRLAHGTVDLLDLDKGKDKEHTVINLDLSGPLRDALALLDSKPLGYLHKLGLDKKMVDGAARARLRFAFPLIKTLPLTALKVDAHASMSDVTLQNVAFGHDLTDGEISLHVDNKGLTASGGARVSSVPLTFSWRRSFEEQSAASIYTARATIEDSQRELFGMPPLTSQYAKGPINVMLRLTDHGKRGSTLDAHADLMTTRLEAPGFNWAKPPGEPASLTAVLRMNANKAIIGIPMISLRSKDATILGQAKMFEDGALSELDISRLRLGDSSLTVQARRARPNAPLRIAVHGSTLDATAITGAFGKELSVPDLPDLHLDGRFDQVMASESNIITNVHLRADRNSNHWSRISLEAARGDDAPLSFKLGPAASGHTEQPFRLSLPDVGKLLSNFGVTTDFQGGNLLAAGNITQDGITSGSIEISPFRVTRAPLLVRMLSVASLTGAVDLLTGRGLDFEALNARFSYDDATHVATLGHLSAYGPSLGVTAQGTVGLRTKTIDIVGTLSPLYIINSLGGHLPFIGGLLTNFKEGGGIFSSTYTIKNKWNNPKIAVNPASLLAPGFLRGLFGGGTRQLSNEQQ